MSVRLRLGDDERRVDLAALRRAARAGDVPDDALLQVPDVTGARWVRAGDLDLHAVVREASIAAWARRWATAPPPVMTALLVGLQLRIWWLVHTPAWSTTLSEGTLWTAPVLEDGEVWRLLTMGLLHVQFGHVAMNLFWLAWSGVQLERALGAAAVLRLYTASVLGGSLLSTFLSPEHNSLGASGGVFGLIAAAVVVGLGHGEHLPPRSRNLFGAGLLPYVVVMLASGFTQDNVDNACHVGGMITGGLLATQVAPPALAVPGSAVRRFAQATWAAIALTLAVVWAAGPRLAPLGPPVQDVAAGAAWSVPQGWRPGRVFTGDGGASHPRGDRAFSVTATLTAAPPSPEAALQDLGEHARHLGWTLTPSAPVAQRFAGASAWRVDAAAERDGEALATTIVVAQRGAWTLTAIWQDRPDTWARAAPLRERVLTSVTWGDPEGLVEARAAWEEAPEAPARQRRYAAALAEVGDGEAAWPLWRARLDAPDATDADWQGALTALLGAPREDALQLVDEALASSPTPRVQRAAADALDALGQPEAARGLLELAWRAAPGDDDLRRARRTRHLDVRVDPDGRPRSLALDATLGVSPPQGSIDRGAATAFGQALAAGRGALRARAARDLPGPAGAAALVLLTRGAPPHDVPSALRGLEADLSGQTPPWWWSEPLPAPDVLAAQLAAVDPAAVEVAIGGAEAG